VDGEERWQFDPREGVCGPFSVPVGASYLEVFGDDDHGALLLAVVPLPEPSGMGQHQPRHLYVTLEGGQTVTIEIALGQTTSGDVNAYYIQVGYFGPGGVDN
jgi:hypothetical protein